MENIEIIRTVTQMLNAGRATSPLQKPRGEFPAGKGQFIAGGSSLLLEEGPAPPKTKIEALSKIFGKHRTSTKHLKQINGRNEQVAKTV